MVATVNSDTSRYRHQIINADRNPIDGGVEGLVEVIKGEVEDSIQRLISKPDIARKPDPIVSEKFTRLSGLVSSAYKRHGLILERAVLERLKQCPWFSVWNRNDFKISQSAISASSDDKNLEYGEGRNLQIDAFVYNERAKSLGAYEIKRASAYFDSGKRQSIETDMKAVRVLLKSYGEKEGLDIQSHASHVIFWYGRLSVKAYGITGKAVDEHFGWPIFEAVERINCLFKERLDEALTRLILNHP
jgi:hypothetical protein